MLENVYFFYELFLLEGVVVVGIMKFVFDVVPFFLNAEQLLFQLHH